MTEAQPPLVVTQEDRDAAADYGDSIGVPHADMRRGELDDSLLIQAFARHRITAWNQRSTPPAESVTRVALAIAREVGGPNFDPFTDAEAFDFAQRLAIAALAALTPSPVAADQSRTIEILRRALAWHGDWQRMATTREDWQREVDEALCWVQENPEEGRLIRPTLAASAAADQSVEVGRLREALRFYADPISYLATQMKEPRTAVHGDCGKRARTALKDSPNVS